MSRQVGPERRVTQRGRRPFAAGNWKDTNMSDSGETNSSQLATLLAAYRVLVAALVKSGNLSVVTLTEEFYREGLRLALSNKDDEARELLKFVGSLAPLEGPQQDVGGVQLPAAARYRMQAAQAFEQFGGPLDLAEGLAELLGSTVEFPKHFAHEARADFVSTSIDPIFPGPGVSPAPPPRPLPKTNKPKDG